MKRFFLHHGKFWLLPLLLCVFLWHSTPVFAKNTGFSFHMLDVGQGLSILVEADGHALLYDGGGGDASSFVVRYLKDEGISDLDYIVASHYDEDHLSGLVGALYAFGCGTVLAPDYVADTQIYASFQDALLQNGADVATPKQGETYSLGDAVVEVIGPAYFSHESENDDSICLCVDYHGIRFLLCGDLEAAGEGELVDSGADLSCDVYVANHHGSASSSSADFLAKALPDAVFLSCGAGNSYGHPGGETMELLQSMGCDLYRTDLQGTVVAYSDGDSLWFSAEPCADWRSGDDLLSESVAEGGSAGDVAEESAAIQDGSAGDVAEESAAIQDGSAGDVAEESVSIQDGSAGDAAEKIAGAPQGALAAEVTYICNVNTGKFHYPDCKSVKQMKETNKKYATETSEELISQGYVPCKNCNPH